MNPKYRINKGFDEYSSGTIVEIIGAGEIKEEVTVSVISGDLSDDFFDIPMSYLTKCRPMTDMVPNPTRRERRIGQPRKQNTTTGESEQVF